MAIKYELKKLESVVSNDLADFINKKYELDQRLFVRFSERLQEEIESVKNSFSWSFLYYKNRQNFERYIRFHQRAIIELTAYLMKYLDPNDFHINGSALNSSKLSQELYWSFQELLNFIWKQFP